MSETKTRGTPWACAIASLVLAMSADALAVVFTQTNLVSDLPGVAAQLDPNLVNPWGIASSATGPFWVSDNHTGVATVYNSSGVPFPVGSPLIVTVPPPLGGAPPSAPTGVIFNSGSNFGGAHFIFATEDGTIAAWVSGAAATLVVDNSPSGAVYKGLASGTSGSQTLLYVANFNAGTIDVFDTTFSPVTVPGDFQDPNLPAGYAPFDIQNIGGNLFVTYAKQDANKHDDASGPGNGFVDVFGTDGVLIRRLISNGPLNSPWGLAIAPSSFGPLAGDLLVGNFGDGMINAFDPTIGTFFGDLVDASNNPIKIPGLWGLLDGNGGNGGNPNFLYFSAGIPGPDKIEDHGLFGSLSPNGSGVDEPGSLMLLAIALASVAALRRIRSLART
jgi:uncharacterized protein (TIGR03118 family)